jgi:N-acetylmuramoyl-L-alanine amidase
MMLSRTRSGALLVVWHLFGGWAQLSAQEGRIQDVRFWSLPGLTRVAIQLSEEIHPRQERLTHPVRHLFDFEGARPGRRGIWTIPAEDDLLRQVRIAEVKPGVTRIVLDLAMADAEIATSELANPYRFMIEIRRRGTTPSATAASAPAMPAAPPSARRRANAVVLETPPTIRARSASMPPVRIETRWPGYRAETATPAKSKPLDPPAVRPAEPTAQPARHTSTGGNSLTRALGLKIRRVVLDPGHGGHDHGSTGPTGLLEKELVLDVARRLGALIERELGAEVIYTRDSDRFVPLEMRTHIANESKADLFLSIHANSSTIRTVSGVETYFLNFAGSREALDVAARENASSERSVFELKELLQKIALQEKLDESREFATKVNAALVRVWGPVGAARNRGIKKAPFIVLIGASMPSVLAEIGFLSNPRDEKEMKKPEVRERLAEALYKGIAQYANSLSHYAIAQRSANE